MDKFKNITFSVMLGLAIGIISYLADSSNHILIYTSIVLTHSMNAILMLGNKNKILNNELSRTKTGLFVGIGVYLIAVFGESSLAMGVLIWGVINIAYVTMIKLLH